MSSRPQIPDSQIRMAAGILGLEVGELHDMLQAPRHTELVMYPKRQVQAPLLSAGAPTIWEGGSGAPPDASPGASGNTADVAEPAKGPAVASQLVGPSRVWVIPRLVS